jgi:hypothetical protein
MFGGHGAVGEPEPAERRHHPLGCDHDDLHVAAVLAHVDVAVRRDRDVVDGVQSRVGGERVVVEDVDRP